MSRIAFPTRPSGRALLSVVLMLMTAACGAVDNGAAPAPETSPATAAPVAAPAPAPTPAPTASSTGSALLFVLPASTDTPGEYPYVSLRGDAAAPPLASDLTVYRDGAAAGRLRIQRRVAGDDSGCTAPDRVAIADADVAAPGAFLADYDLNPEGRFSQRSATNDERAALLRLVAQSPIDQVGAADLAKLTEAVRADASAATIAVFGDRKVSGREWALLAFDAVSGEGEAARKTGLTALFQRQSAGAWTRSFARAGSGCDACESEPETRTYLGFGDFDGDGRLDLLFERRLYEGWSYEVLKDGGTDWTLTSVGGGGGC